MGDKKDSNSKQIDIKYDLIGHVDNDPLQQNQSFYSLKYPNTSYPIDQVRERLFLSPLTFTNIHTLLVNIHDIFEEDGCHFSEELCLKPLNVNTLKVIRSNPKTSAQDY